MILLNDSNKLLRRYPTSGRELDVFSFSYTPHQFTDSASYFQVTYMIIINWKKILIMQRKIVFIKEPSEICPESHFSLDLLWNSQMSFVLLSMNTWQKFYTEHLYPMKNILGVSFQFCVFYSLERWVFWLKRTVIYFIVEMDYPKWRKNARLKSSTFKNPLHVIYFSIQLLRVIKYIFSVCCIIVRSQLERFYGMVHYITSIPHIPLAVIKEKAEYHASWVYS